MPRSKLWQRIFFQFGDTGNDDSIRNNGCRT